MSIIEEVGKVGLTWRSAHADIRLYLLVVAIKIERWGHAAKRGGFTVGYVDNQQGSNCRIASGPVLVENVNRGIGCPGSTGNNRKHTAPCGLLGCARQILIR